METKKSILKIRVAIAVLFAVTFMLSLSCGGGENKKSSGAEKIAQEIVKDAVKKSGIKETKTKEWPNNEYTKQLTKPDIGIKVAGIAELGGNKLFSVTFDDGTTKEQIKACVEKVKSDGFTKESSESGGDTFYMFSAKNNAGYNVLISWTSTAAGLMVSKSE